MGAGTCINLIFDKQAHVMGCMGAYTVRCMSTQASLVDASVAFSLKISG